MPRWIRSSLVALLATLGALTGCAQQVPDVEPSWIDGWSPTRVAGIEVTAGPSGPRPDGPASRLVAENSDGGPLDRLALNALDDLQIYWKDRLPLDFGRPFDPVDRIVSYDSTRPTGQVCGIDTAGAANAFYCTGEQDTVAWDRGELLPILDRLFGPLAVVTVLAHEVGHAVQFRLSDAPAASTIVREQQADCYTGAFFRWVAEGDSPRFQVSTGPGLNQVLSTLFFIRDNLGTSFDDVGAHGTAFDRVTAFQLGFSDGPRRCAEIDETEIRERITQQGADQADDVDAGGADLRVDDKQNLTALAATLREAFGPASGGRFRLDSAACPGGLTTTPVTYCPASVSVHIDLDGLAEIGASMDEGGLGDFAAFAAVASRYALAVQHAAGLPLDGLVAAQRTACLTGAWAASIRAEQGRRLRLSPGDLDEAVAEMLAVDSLVAADVLGRSVPSGFARVTAFRDGYTAGIDACLANYR
ncbi:hypothetical protein [Micromonospora sp. WMMD1082]|uniref:hypothetical protein n=1 Tax=Micromonospora sp. WMMD1082 TaxID=3016104 RepID=UPI002417726B|nr:hypothetical protein [Micromonospora sp. WMMD1082]MDG4795741.1 hypothetical protein [Micromonospora sp. WMMD1082]